MVDDGKSSIGVPTLENFAVTLQYELFDLKT